MAMTKKEKELVSDLKKQVAILKVFRFTEDVEPDVMPPTVFGDVATGYEFNSHTGVISKAWTESHFHGSGWVKPKYGGSQCAIRLYSTELLALKAMRRAMEKTFAEKLASVDRMIKDAKKGVSRF